MDGWVRPREPQLPLYAITREGPLGAVTLATIRTGEVGFAAIQEGNALGGLKPAK